MGTVCCIICRKECDRLWQHYRAHNGWIPWNAGLSKDTDERIRQQAATISKKMTGRRGHPVSTKVKERLSQVAIQTGFGGYKPGSGRGRKGWYKGYWCDSSWELAWVVYHLDRGVVFERNKERFPYADREGKVHEYVPDFFLPGEDVFVEVKGFVLDKDVFQRKLAAVGRPMQVWDKMAMKSVLAYVVEKYGPEPGFTKKLYE